MHYLSSLRFKFSIFGRDKATVKNRPQWDVSYAKSEAKRLKALRVRHTNQDGGMMGGMQVFMRLMEKTT